MFPKTKLEHNWMTFSGFTVYFKFRVMSLRAIFKKKINVERNSV